MTFQKRAILVTGGCGFIGSNFINYMLETYKDVYLRLKDYLGPDIIQDQLGDGIVNGFIIDFMMSRCKIIK